MLLCFNIAAPIGPLQKQFISLHGGAGTAAKTIRELERMSWRYCRKRHSTAPILDEDDVEDLDEAPDGEVEQIGGEILIATVARTSDELKAEITP